MLEQLHKPRYLALGAVMLLVATLCVAAGTWQIFRFLEKRSENGLLRHNAHAPVAAVDSALAVTTAPNAKKRAAEGRFRHVRVSGAYDRADQVVVRERTVDGTVGFLVLTPLRTASGAVLLVVRGFVAADGNVPTAVAAAPSGPVTILARVEGPETSSDHFGDTAGQVTAINPAEAARRLHAAVYDGYAELLDKQPGAAGLTPIPDPDLSNPAGGAVEPQHAAYVLQWYLFALLALAAPVVMARAESRAPDVETGDFDEPVEPAPVPDIGEQQRAAKLLDRYGGARTR